MLTDNQEKTFQKLKAGMLTAKEKADFYYRLSSILKKDLDRLDDLTHLLDEIPDSYLEKIDLLKAMKLAMKLSEKIVDKLNPPQIYKKQNKTEIEDLEDLEVIKSFSFKPSEDKYYLEDKDEKQEFGVYGYSFIRSLTQHEKTLINDILDHVEYFDNRFTRPRLNSEIIDRPLEDFLSKDIPEMIKDAKKKGLSYRIEPDFIGIPIRPNESRIEANKRLKSVEDKLLNIQKQEGVEGLAKSIRRNSSKNRSPPKR